MSGDEQLAANLIGAVAKERGGWDKQVEVVLAFMAEIRRLRAPRPDVEALLDARPCCVYGITDVGRNRLEDHPHA